MARRGDDPFTHSLTDLMSGLAVIFLLVALLFIILTATANRDIKQKAEQYSELTKRDAAARGSAAELERLLRDLFARSQARVTVHRDEKRNPLLIFVLFDSEHGSGEGLFFERGSAELTAEARAFIAARFPELFRDLLCPRRDAIESVVLEGHTDTVANFQERALTLTPCAREHDARGAGCDELSFNNNVALSARRAQNVIFQARGLFLKQGAADLVSCLDEQFTVAGRGEVDPFIAPGRDPLKRGADDPGSRRVVLKIKVRPPTLERE